MCVCVCVFVCMLVTVVPVVTVSVKVEDANNETQISLFLADICTGYCSLRTTLRL